MLSMLLDRFPGVGRIYLMVRASTEAESEARFWESIVPSPALDPLRDRYGAELDEFLREKVVVVSGDITDDHLGFTPERAEAIASDIDVLLNSSGRVTFNPPLEAALKTNVTGTLNTIAFAKRMKRPALVHVSTCFVAGDRSGEVWENEPLIGYFPRRAEEASEFSVDKEIDDCERLAVRVRDEAKDKSLADRFRETAKKRFVEEGRDPDDEKAMSLAIARERKNWIRSRLTDLGIEKAQGWGWPNIYTYTKSLGEQLVAAEEDIKRAIVRPAIVESALSFPVSRVERRLHDHRASRPDGDAGTELVSGEDRRHPRRHSGRHGRVRDARGHGAGHGGRAGSRLPSVVGRHQPVAPRAARRPPRPPQARVFSRARERQQMAECARVPHGSASGRAGAIREILDAAPSQSDGSKCRRRSTK